MGRAKSAIRTFTSRLTLSLASWAGHTVRIANLAAPKVPALAGFSLISWGAAMIYTPAGWIAGGISLLLIASEVNAGPRTPQKPPQGGE